MNFLCLCSVKTYVAASSHLHDDFLAFRAFLLQAFSLRYVAIGFEAWSGSLTMCHRILDEDTTTVASKQALKVTDNGQGIHPSEGAILAQLMKSGDINKQQAEEAKQVPQLAACPEHAQHCAHGVHDDV